jgi:CubicO group peptidase (beta-lactamase class C family)
MFDRIGEFIAKELDARRIPGAAIAVVRDSEPVWSRGFGVASIEGAEPMTPQTVFPVQSLTKVVTATAILQLRDCGLLDLDDAANEHLGQAHIRNEWESDSPVTVRQLLTHTSGLPCDVDAATPQLSREVSITEWVNQVAKTVRRPGTEIVYANWGYDSLGPIVETLSGMEWDRYLEERVLAPAGMQSSCVGTPAAALPTASGHFLSVVDGAFHRIEPPWPPVLPDPSGAVSSTVEDMAMFLAAHLRGGEPITSRETGMEMQRVHARESALDSGMGLGWRVTRSNGRKLICHGGDGSGFTNFMGGYPDRGVGVVLTLNRGGAACARSVIANTVLGILADAPPSASATVAPGHPSCAGTYRSTYWDIEADLNVDGDTPAITVAPGLVVSDPGETSRLYPLGDSFFRGEGGMFHGFEVSLREEAKGYTLSGGLYPFTFERIGDVENRLEPVADESADLAGDWRGTIETPLGPLALELTVEGPAKARASTPFARDLELEECAAGAGRISGRFTLTVPTVGELILHPRLVAHEGGLEGTVYGWGAFGELPFPAHLEKQ